MSYYKAEVEYTYCCQRKFYPQNGYQSSSKTPYFLISPVNIGRFCSLAEKYEYLFGSIEIKIQDKLKLSPLFKFMLRCQLLYDMTTYSTKTQGYLTDLSKELKTSFEMNKQRNKCDLLSKQIDQIRKEIDLNYKQQQTKAQQIPQQYRTKYLQTFTTFTRLPRIIAFDGTVNQYTQQCLTELRQILNKHQKDYEIIFGNKDILSPQVLLRQARKIQLLRKPVLNKKLKNFQRKYKGLYGCRIMTEGSSRNELFVIKINKLFKQNEPILLSVEKMVQMRDDQINYKPQSFQLINEVWKQFRRYYNAIVNGDKAQRKQTFHYISPQFIVFNQYTLSLRFHYKPIYYEMLGLTQQPCNIISRLTFFPTPKQFNYYQSLREVQNPGIKRLLKDPFFGNRDFVDLKSQQYVKEQQQQEIQKEIEKAVQIREEQSVYKFILTCYFILHSIEYGKTKQPNTTALTQKFFIQQLRSLTRQLHSNSAYLQNYIGIANKKTQDEQFLFKMPSLEQHFSNMQIQEDSVIKSLKFKKLQRFFNLRFTVINEINSVLMNQNFFYKIFNTKRYMIIYLIAADQFLTQLEMINKIEEQKYDERRELKVFLVKNILKKKFMFKKDNIGALQALDNLFEKIQQHGKRDLVDKQSRYLNQDPIGLKMFGFIHEFQEIKASLLDLEKKIQKLQKGDHSYSYRQSYLKILKEENNLISQNKIKYQKILKVFVFSQMKSNDKTLHKYQENSPEQVKQYFNLIGLKVKLLVQTLQTVDFEKNSLLYETSVIPLFRIVEGKCFHQDRMTAKENRIDNINFQNMEEILNCSQKSSKNKYRKFELQKNEESLFWEQKRGDKSLQKSKEIKPKKKLQKNSEIKPKIQEIRVSNKKIIENNFNSDKALLQEQQDNQREIYGNKQKND